MNTEPSPFNLQPDDPRWSAEHIGLIGYAGPDVRGLMNAANVCAARGVHTLIGLGDYGWSRPERLGASDLDDLDWHLTMNRQTLSFIEGAPPISVPQAMRETFYGHIQPIRSRIDLLSGGLRVPFGENRTFGTLRSGAAEPPLRDVLHERAPITDVDIDLLGEEDLDVLLGSDPVSYCPPIESYFDPLAQHMPREQVERGARVRYQATLATLHTRPHLFMGTGIEKFFDETVGYPSSRAYVMRIIMLDDPGKPDVTSIAILNTRTRNVELLQSNGTAIPAKPPVTRLTDADTGLWYVHTLYALHILNLDLRSDTRVLHGHRSRPIRLAELQTLELGKRGEWTHGSWDEQSVPSPYLSSMVRYITATDDDGL